MAGRKPQPNRHKLTNEDRQKKGPNRAASKGGYKLPDATKAPTIKVPGPYKRGVNRTRNAVGGKRCDAKKRHGGLCALPSGWGTKHLGIGKCKYHGGNAPTHVRSAISKEAKVFFGTPMEINAMDALMWMIKITAGEIKWLSDQMATLQEKDWVEDTIAGKQFHLFARERQKRADSLARYSAQAISLGIAERAVKLAETYADLLARLIQGILGDLDLTPEQRAKAPQVVRKHLIAIDGGMPDAGHASHARLALEAGRSEAG